MSIHTTTSKVVIDAPPSQIWSALTKPELVKQWQYGSNVVTDWQPGSPIRFSSEWEGTVYEQWGKVLEVKPNKLLKYSLFAPRPDLEDKPENYFTMTYLLNESNGKTTLSIIQEDPRQQNSDQPQEEGENSVLIGLKKLVESL